MCRWFAYISPTEPVLLSDVLITPANAITRQCSEHYLPGLLPRGHEKDLGSGTDELIKLRNSLLNMDGLGVAWYTPSSSAYTSQQEGPRPALYKSQSPPFNDFNFRSLCENTESNCLFAHIRASSGGAVTQVNSHPFVFGRHTFMHNGVVSNFTRIRRQMTLLMDYDAYCNIQGSTDSEHAAALYMTFLVQRAKEIDPSLDTSRDKNNSVIDSSMSKNASSDKREERDKSGTKIHWQNGYAQDIMLYALTKTITTILDLQHSASSSFSSSSSPTSSNPNPNPNSNKMTASSLNFAATDGSRLITCRFRNHTTQQPPSLYWSELAGRTLNRKYPGNPDGHDKSNSDQIFFGAAGDEIGKHTIVASEPTTVDEEEKWHLIKKNCALVVGPDGIEKEILIVYDRGRFDATD